MGMCISPCKLRKSSKFTELNTIESFYLEFRQNVNVDFISVTTISVCSIVRTNLKLTS